SWAENSSVAKAAPGRVPSARAPDASARDSRPPSASVVAGAIATPGGRRPSSKRVIARRRARGPGLRGEERLGETHQQRQRAGGRIDPIALLAGQRHRVLEELDR